MNCDSNRGLVFDIQHYAVHDGPGIRTLVFLKGCSLRCQWCSNPESQEHFPELKYLSSFCRKCFSCIQACPHNHSPSITSIPEFLSSLKLNCRNCNDLACTQACPHEALQSVGKWMSANEVFDIVAADRDFYRNSGGGLTLSGGEPLLQKEFCSDLLKKCQEQNISTAIETAGLVPTETLTNLEPLIDLFLFDLKVIDESLHQQLTGTSNQQILKNLETLCHIKKSKIKIRMVVVPNLNDSEKCAIELTKLCERLQLSEIELLHFHSLGQQKYFQLNRVPALPIYRPDEIESSFMQFHTYCTKHGLPMRAFER